MSKSPESPRRVRISKIAGRYLVFDVEDVLYIRRYHNICSVFIGTIPQNPTQNIFMGLPIELFAEEARVLVDQRAALVVDDTAAHVAQLSSRDESARRAYIQSFKAQRSTAQKALEEESHRKQAVGRAMRAKKLASKRSSEAPTTSDAVTDVSKPEEEKLFDATPETAVTPAKTSSAVTALTITPTTSSGLFQEESRSAEVPVPKAYPLYAHLNSKGYFITPGIRFGGDYSVYPGDPFRYHAHFLATGYEWDEEITMLDLVSSGRLGTSVKKGFLMGAQQPRPVYEEDMGDSDQAAVRTFCIEWAGM